MNCRDIQDKLTAYLLGDLDAAQAEEVRRHLPECQECQNAARDLEATISFVRKGLADTTASFPLKLSAERRQALFAKSARSNKKIRRGFGWSILRIAAVIGIIAVSASLFLPNLGSVRENARRVNDLSNLNGIYKAAAAWGLDPRDSFRPAFPSSLDQLVKETKIAPQMLVNPETGKRVEYYPATDSTDGERVMLVSPGKKGRNIVKVAGSGMWIEDGTPEAAKLDRQLAELKKRGSRDSYAYSDGVLKSLPDGSSRAISRDSADKGDISELSAKCKVSASKMETVSRFTDMDSQIEPDVGKRVVSVGGAEYEKTQGTFEEGAVTVLSAGPHAQPLAAQAVAKQTRQVSVSVQSMSSRDASRTAAKRFSITAPSSFVRVEAPAVAPQVQISEVKVDTQMAKSIADSNIQRLQGVREFQKGWGVSMGSGGGSGGAGGSGSAGGGRAGTYHAVRAKFSIFRAKYQDGDWNCNPEALNNMMRQIHLWSKDRIDAKIREEVLDVGSDQIFTLKPPFIFLTGTKGMNLVDSEVKNLRDYLTLGGAIWADAALPGKGTHFDLSIRREMKRVLPDRDFEIVRDDHPIFNTFFPDIGLPPGLNNSRLPVEQVTIGDDLAILYTLNGYSTLLNYPLSKDDKIDWEAYKAKQTDGKLPPSASEITDLLVRNSYMFGVNNVVHLLTRYQDKFRFLPKTLPIVPTNQPAATNQPAPPALPAPAKTNAPAADTGIKKVVPKRALDVNPFVTAAENQFSTFGIDVDTASYALTRNCINRGELPPVEEVRTEEFVNYFNYAYQPPRNKAFAVYSEIGSTPFGRGLSVLKIGVQAQRLGREQKRPLALTLLIDTSGSMATPDRIELLKSALHRMIERLDPNDLVAVIQFDSQARLLLAHTRASEKSKILAVIDALQTSGSTNLEEGMKLAYAIAARAADSRRLSRVILLSDGVANLGTVAAEEILGSVEKYRKQGVYCSVFGFGSGAYNDAMLQTLADKGDGAYAFIDSDEEAERVLVEDLAARLNIVARDAKIQVEFNPKRVIRFRQLGYEKRQLKKEEFRDDTVDAGEVGSGQCATALYELELNQNYDEPIGTVRVRYKNVLTDIVEEIEQPIVLQSKPPAFEAMDAHFRLAAGVAEFAEILRGSPYAAGRRLEDVAGVLRPVALELNVDRRIGELARMTECGLVPKFAE